MADKKLSELDVISTATISTTADLLHLVDDSEGTNHRITPNQIIDDKAHTYTEDQTMSGANILIGANEIQTSNTSISQQTLAGDRGLALQPTTSNFKGIFHVLPNGSTAGAVNASFDFWNTDIIANGTDYEGLIIVLRDSEYRINTISNGSGTTTRPVQFQFDGTTLFEMTSASTTTMSQNLTITDAKNIVLNTTTGTKLGTATTQKLGFWNATPVVQPAHIVDADGTLADITTKFNQLLSDLAGQGLQAAS